MTRSAATLTASDLVPNGRRMHASLQGCTVTIDLAARSFFSIPLRHKSTQNSDALEDHFSRSKGIDVSFGKSLTWNEMTSGTRNGQMCFVSRKAKMCAVRPNAHRGGCGILGEITRRGSTFCVSVAGATIPLKGHFHLAVEVKCGFFDLAVFLVRGGMARRTARIDGMNAAAL